MLETWQRAIPRKDRPLRSLDVVCSLHFTPDCITTHFDKLVLPDGYEIQESRQKPKLKPEAIPAIFPNLPKYLSKTGTKRKAPTQRGHIPERRRRTEDNSTLNEPG